MQILQTPNSERAHPHMQQALSEAAAAATAAQGSHAQTPSPTPPVSSTVAAETADGGIGEMVRPHGGKGASEQQLGGYDRATLALLAQVFALHPTS